LHGSRAGDDRQCDAIEEIAAGDAGHGANLTAAGGATDAPALSVACPRRGTSRTYQLALTRKRDGNGRGRCFCRCTADAMPGLRTYRFHGTPKP
jgi:hypothetical protein